MGRLLNNEAAEREANKIAFQFQNSNDVIRDMSRAYNADFSNIRIHTDESADAKVRSAGRDAIASGNDLFFGKGIYESKDPASNALVAHELAHTMQQGSVMSEGAVSESAPMGAEQGGLISWFRNWRAKRKRKKALEKGTFVHSDEERKPIMSDFNRPNLTATKEGKLVEDKGDGELVEVKKNDSESSSKKVNTASKDSYRKEWNRRRNLAKPRSYYSSRPMDEEYNAIDAEFGRMVEDSNEQQDINMALEALALRRTGDKAAVAEQNLRKHILDDDNYGDYISYIDKYGTDYDGILKQSDKWIDPKFGKSFKIGTEMNDIASDVMDMIGGGLQTKDGMEYLSHMINGIKDANIFKNKDDTPLNYMLNTIFTGEAGKFMKKVVIGEYSRNDQDTKTKRQVVFIDALKNMQLLPRIDRMSEEERKTLPQSLQMLYRKYVDFMNMLNESM